MARYTLQPSYDPPELELGDSYVFEVRWLTKDVEARLAPLEQEIQRKLEGAKKGEDLVAAIGSYFDVILKRIEVEPGAKNGSKPSTLLKKAWEANGLPLEHLLFLYQVANGAGAPPT